MQLGFGSTKSEGTGYTSEPDIEISGTGGVFRIDIGGAVKENFILFGTLGGISISDPDVESGGLSGTMNGTSRISDIGAGVTYYFMPANFYIGGSLNIARNKIDPDGASEGSSDSGYGLNFDIGKEWWVSDNWGLGVGGFIYFGNVPDQGDDGEIRNTAVGLFFSATYN